MICTECKREGAVDHTYLNIKSMCPDCYNEIYLRDDHDTEEDYDEES